jgi:hypothetical protein
VELLPYKIFICQKCGHEFQMQSRAAKDLVHSMLAAMQPVAAAPSPAQQARQRFTVRLPSPEARPVATPIPRPAQPAAPAVQPRSALAAPNIAAPPPQVTTPPDWEPYHLDNDMDNLFDQFKEE